MCMHVYMLNNTFHWFSLTPESGGYETETLTFKAYPFVSWVWKHIYCLLKKTKFILIWECAQDLKLFQRWQLLLSNLNCNFDSYHNKSTGWIKVYEIKLLVILLYRIKQNRIVLILVAQIKEIGSVSQSTSTEKMQH